MSLTKPTHYSSTLVIGAGITGLMAARHLQAAQVDTIVVEKGERVGGRIATAPAGSGRADTGAQFFTVRTPIFEQVVAEWLAAGVVFAWGSGWSVGSALDGNDGHPRYAGQGGLYAITEDLAQRLTVHTAVNIQSIFVTEKGWTAVAHSGEIYQSQAIILTPPVPVSTQLLQAGKVTMTPADQAALARISYAPTICGVVVVDGEVNLPEPGALQRWDHRISWIGDNQRKGISPEAKTITMHVNPAYSQLWQLSPEAELKGALRRELQPFLATDSEIIEIQLSFWPFALPTTLHPQKMLLAQNLPPLVFAGDAFDGPRVEGAALSGIAAAVALKELLQS